MAGGTARGRTPTATIGRRTSARRAHQVAPRRADEPRRDLLREGDWSFARGESDPRSERGRDAFDSPHGDPSDSGGQRGRPLLVGGADGRGPLLDGGRGGAQLRDRRAQPVVVGTGESRRDDRSAGGRVPRAGSARGCREAHHSQPRGPRAVSQGGVVRLGFLGIGLRGSGDGRRAGRGLELSLRKREAALRPPRAAARLGRERAEGGTVLRRGDERPGRGRGESRFVGDNAELRGVLEAKQGT
mmetsp:Transcript_18317/g.27532  ORF Transcript_18317/g.27532 Transcript_18317/m.27532 type:complete len:244 (-) Transcript_18317:362-1093(-)